MLVIFLLGIAPKEYLHDLIYDHEDTVHSVVKKGELVISGKHTHCSFLGFVFAPFIASAPQFISFAARMVYSAPAFSVYQCHYVKLHYAQYLRGPPAVLS